MENWKAMQEIMADLGIEDLTEDQIRDITASYDNHIEMLYEMDSYQHDYSPGCDECANLESRLKESEKRNTIFENSVKRRRNCERVWIEGDEVKYE